MNELYKKAGSSMMLELEEYRYILESSPNMIWRSGLDTKCNYFNRTWLNFTGRTIEQEIGNGWAEGVHPEDFDRCVNTYLDAFSKQNAFEMNYRLKRHDGEYRIINDQGVPYYLEDGSFAGYIGSCIDVTEKMEGESLRERAMKDGLTGLFNRQHLMIVLEKEIEKSIVNNQTLSLLMLDIDNFKSINDEYGHVNGDTTITKVASIISSSIRDGDITGRFGGDEFVIILPKSTVDSAKNIAERVRDNIAKAKIYINETIIDSSVSIGIACLNKGQSISDLIEQSDKAMYRAKAEGGNRISI